MVRVRVMVSVRVRVRVRVKVKGPTALIRAPAPLRSGQTQFRIG